jgi:PmbA protein
MMKTNLNKTNSVPLKSKADCQKILEETLILCRKHGATDAVVDFQQEQGFDVDVRMGDVESVSFHQKQGLGVVVYVGQRKGIASSTDLQSSSLEMIVKAACDMAKVSAEDPHYGLADEAYWKELQHRSLDLYHPWHIEPEQAIERALQLESTARQADARIFNSDGANVSSYQFVQACMNTRGFEEYLQSTRHGMSVSLIAKQGEDMQTDYAYSSVRHPKDLEQIPVLAELAAQRVCERLGGRTLATQQVPVVFSNRLSSGIIGQLISAIMGTQLYRKNSFLCDALGQQLFPSFMHIQEHPFIQGGLGSANYDSDGIPTKDNIFVEDGILKQYALGVYSARRLQLAPTGNADGTHNLMVRANTKDLNSILKQMDRGFLVTHLMGQGVNVLTGDYSRGASGFWVEHGEIQFPVEGVTIAGNLKEMFKSIVAIGEDVDKNYSTKCGSLLIDRMTVAGQ